MVGVPGRVVGSIDTVGWLLSGVLDATRPWDQTQTPWSHASKVDPCGLGGSRCLHPAHLYERTAMKPHFPGADP